jgi:hypothetical protein
MSFDTYEDLIEEATDELGRNDLKGKMIDWLTLIERRLSRDVKYFRGTVFTTTSAFVAGQDFVTLPDGLLEILLLRIDVTDAPRWMTFVSLDKLVDVKSNAARTGITFAEAAHHLDQYTLLVEPAPTNADPFTLWWRGKLPLVDQSIVTSQVLEEAPDLLLEGLLYHGFKYTRNAGQMAEKKALYDECVMAYHKFLWNVQFGAGVARVRPDTMPNDSHTRQYSTP